MYAVIRRYTTSEIFNELVQQQTEVQALLRGVPGFISYYAIRSGDGGAHHHGLRRPDRYH